MKLALARRVLARRGANVPLADVAGAMMAEHVVAMVAWGALICGSATVAPAGPGAGWAAARPRGSAPCGPSAAPGPPCITPTGRSAARPPPAYVGLAALGQWAFAWLAIAAVLAALGLGHVGLAAAGVILAGVTIAHALPITPGGVGINQIGAMLPLTATYGAAPEQALAFAVALALSETGPGIVLGAVCAAREAALANWHSRARPIGTSPAGGRRGAGFAPNCPRGGTRLESPP